MSKVVSDSNLVSFGKAFKARLSDVAISGSYNDLVDTPGDLQEYRQFTLFSDQAEGSYPSTPGNNDWKWYTNLDKLAPTSNPNITWYGDWSTVATSTENTPIIWVAVATFQSSDGTKVSDWEVYQATGSTGSSGAKGDTGNGISSVTKTSSAGLVDTYTITFTDGTTKTFTVTNGETGTGIESVNEYYLATSASSGVTRSTSGWTTSVQTTNSTNKYLWNYECVEYSDNTVVNSDPVIIGTYGDKGDDGSDGRGISSITEYYLASTASSNVTTSTSGWTTSVQTINSTNRYLWNYEVVTYTDNTTHTTTPVIIGVYGEKGDPGTNGTNGTNGSDGFFLNTDTTFIAVEVDPTAKATSTVFQRCNVKLYKGSTQENISGLGINDSTYTNDSATVSNVSLVGHKTGGYYDYVTVSINSGQILSSVQNIDVYVRGAVSGFTTQFKIIVAPIKEGQAGTNGVGISSVVEYYLASSNSTGVTTSTSGWSTNIPTTNATNKYLWNYERVNYSDSTHDDTDPVIISMYSEDGRGISSITEHYLATSSSTGVTKSTSGWTTSVQTVTSTNKYLWNYETVTYTDNTTSDTDPVIIGTYGDKGDPGTNGTNGRGIERRVVKYMTTTTTAAPSVSSNSWSDNITSPDSTNKYLWKKTITTYTDNTVENDIDLITIYTDAASSDIAYLVETFGEANISNNDGVYLNNLVAVKNTANNQPIAMLNGTDVLEDNTEGKMIIAAGMNGMDSSASGYTKPVFQVYESGKLVAQDAKIEGSITATSGNIGDFEISYGVLTAENGGTQSTVELSPDGVRFYNSNDDYIRIGDVINGENNISATIDRNTYTVQAANAGSYHNGVDLCVKDGTVAINNASGNAIIANGDVRIAGDIECENISIPNGHITAGEQGFINGHKTGIMVLNSSTTLTDTDIRENGTFIINAADITITLPDPDRSVDGCAIRIINSGNNDFYLDEIYANITYVNTGSSGQNLLSLSGIGVYEAVFSEELYKILVYKIV